MKYLIKKGTDTFSKLHLLDSRISEANEIVRALVEKLGVTNYLSSRNGSLNGVPRGFEFIEQPVGWKPVKGYSKFYYPKRTKTNKSLLDQLDTIPRIELSELNNAVGFKPQSVSEDKFCFSVGIVWGNEYYLLSVNENAQYTPAPDMEEITVGQWKKLAEGKTKPADL